MPRDPRIGELMREGVTVFYCSNLDGRGQQYYEAPTEAGLVAYLESWDAAKRAIHGANYVTAITDGDGITRHLSRPIRLF